MRLAAFSACVFSVLLLGCSTPNPLQKPTDGASGGSSGGSSATGGGPGVTAELVLTPSSGVLFGPVTIGSSAAAIVTVTNSGGVGATVIADGSVGLGDFGYVGGPFPGTGGSCGGSLAATAGCRLAVSFVPTKAGPQSAKLTLTYNDGTTVQSVAIVLTGTGKSGVAGGDGQTVDHLGTFPTDQANNETTVLTAVKQATDDAITIVAFADSSHQDDGLLVDPIYDPNALQIEEENLQTDISRTFINDGVTAALIPQSPDYLAPSGNYTFGIQNTSGGNIDVDVFVVHPLAALPLTNPTTPDASHLDVNFFFTGGGENATDAQTNPVFQLIVQQFVALYGQKGAACNGNPPAGSLGLCIDSINYIDIDPSYAHIAGDPDETPSHDKSIPELFSQTANHPIGLSLFFVDDVSLGASTAGYTLLGYDGALPGPAAFTGNGRSGAVIIMPTLPQVSDSDYTEEVGQLSATIAHEGGHFLGLFHNQEGSCLVDNISDTPCDPACVCQGGGFCYTVVPPACADDPPENKTCCAMGDWARNTMFWFANSERDTSFSAEQSLTTHRHPMVHP